MMNKYYLERAYTIKDFEGLRNRVACFSEKKTNTGETIYMPCDSHGIIFSYDDCFLMKQEIDKFLKFYSKEAIDNFRKKQIDYLHKQIYDEETYSKVKKSRDKSGYVYFIKQIDKNIFKIGLTKNINKRFEQISTKLPFETEIYCLIKTNNMIDLEKNLHNHFDKVRMNGEWFDLSEFDMSCLENIIKLYDETYRIVDDAKC